MIVNPPFESGDCHDNVNFIRPATAVSARGAPATPAYTGVTVTVDEAAPRPTALTAETLNWYCVPLVRPVTVAVVETDTPSANVVHTRALLPALVVAYSTT